MQANRWIPALHGWAVAEEPAHLNPPPNLIAATLFDGLFQAPLLLFIVLGLIGQRRWLAPLGLIYAGVGTTNMFFYFTQTFLGEHPPPNLAYYRVFNLPWLLALEADVASSPKSTTRRKPICAVSA